MVESVAKNAQEIDENQCTGPGAIYHPDKQSTDVPAGTVEECIQKFIEVDQAWKILGNEETKKEYDLQRHVVFDILEGLNNNMDYGFDNNRSILM
ncbi:hypothetical protein E2I00_019471 [Balaenoptera physalus]|uniref:J domain-containing protein n=1 Tax=Balaenoptera physalus TaxID=9770 RepID=A0A643BYC0_BALPH|nr:hypothetical protein E2I00_019471 [Balaenoptera physalus]